MLIASLQKTSLLVTTTFLPITICDKKKKRKSRELFC
jgi:hypothetical protein